MRSSLLSIYIIHTRFFFPESSEGFSGKSAGTDFNDHVTRVWLESTKGPSQYSGKHRRSHSQLWSSRHLQVWSRRFRCKIYHKQERIKYTEMSQKISYVNSIHKFVHSEQFIMVIVSMVSVGCSLSSPVLAAGRSWTCRSRLLWFLHRTTAKFSPTSSLFLRRPSFRNRIHLALLPHGRAPRQTHCCPHHHLPLLSWETRWGFPVGPWCSFLVVLSLPYWAASRRDSSPFL